MRLHHSLRSRSRLTPKTAWRPIPILTLIEGLGILRPHSHIPNYAYTLRLARNSQHSWFKPQSCTFLTKSTHLMFETYKTKCLWTRRPEKDVLQPFLAEDSQPRIVWRDSQSLFSRASHLGLCWSLPWLWRMNLTRCKWQARKFTIAQTWKV